MINYKKFTFYILHFTFYIFTFTVSAGEVLMWAADPIIIPTRVEATLGFNSNYSWYYQEKAPWVDIKKFITPAHKAQGFIDVKIRIITDYTFDDSTVTNPAVIYGNAWSLYYGDQDYESISAEKNIRASADGQLCEMITGKYKIDTIRGTDKNRAYFTRPTTKFDMLNNSQRVYYAKDTGDIKELGNYVLDSDGVTYYNSHPAGYVPDYLKSLPRNSGPERIDGYITSGITMRFEVPREVNNYYRIWMGTTVWYYKDNYNGLFWQFTMTTDDTLPSGPYADFDIEGAASDYSRKWRRDLFVGSSYTLYWPARHSFNAPCGVDLVFDASPTIMYNSSVSIKSYQWNFGDGGLAAGKVVSHRFENEGTYVVTLALTDSDNKTYIEHNSSSSLHIEGAKKEVYVNVINKPTSYGLLAPGPNPWYFWETSKLNIKYYLENPSYVKIYIYSVSGTLVKKLVDEDRSAGYNLVEWDGNNDYGNSVASGIYVCFMQAGGTKASRKIFLVR